MFTSTWWAYRNNVTEWSFKATAELTISWKMGIDLYHDKEVSLFWKPIESLFLLAFKKLFWIWKTLGEGTKVTMHLIEVWALKCWETLTETERLHRNSLVSKTGPLLRRQGLRAQGCFH